MADPFGSSESELSRRMVLKLAGAGVLASTLSMLDALAWAPPRLAWASPPRLPDIQFDIGDYIAPARSIDGVQFRFGPAFTVFATARLDRTPTKHDQEIMEDALNTIEDHYPFSPSGVFLFVAYGIPYFDRFPGGMHGPVVSEYMPRLLTARSRYALEEAAPSPTDVSPLNPGISKQTFNVPVVIERNDFLLTLRSDSTDILGDVLGWLTGSHELRGQQLRSPRFGGLFAITSTRAMFQQMGLPRKVAEAHRLPYASRIHDRSPMWMGFADQQVAGSGPASITTFQGNASARVTDTDDGSYFHNGSIQHLSHVILDMAQFYGDDEPFTERVQYMFRSNPIPSTGNADQFTNGGGPAFLPNLFRGTDDARANAEAEGTFQGRHRMGHLAALQRSSRAPDGTPMHIRMDGPGFDNMDVPDGTEQPKLQFTVFLPTAELFRTMRRHQASLDLVDKYGVADDDNGVERFITATRRQNYLVPPRRHRAFPLIDLVGVPSRLWSQSSRRHSATARHESDHVINGGRLREQGSP